MYLFYHSGGSGPLFNQHDVRTFQPNCVVQWPASTSQGFSVALQRLCCVRRRSEVTLFNLTLKCAKCFSLTAKNFQALADSHTSMYPHFGFCHPLQGRSISNFLIPLFACMSMSFMVRHKRAANSQTSVVIQQSRQERQFIFLNSPHRDDWSVLGNKKC